MTVNIKPCLDIFGWMTEQELTWLAEQAQSHHMIAEIGSWMGRSTMALARHTPGVVFSIDTWDSPLNQWCTENDLNKNNYSRDSVFNTYLHNLGPLVGTTVFPFICMSRGAAWMFRQKFDMVFIDAGHDYTSVHDDITEWKPLITPGGLICGHDYSTDFVDLREVVDKLVPNRKIAPGTTIWYDTI